MNSENKPQNKKKRKKKPFENFIYDFVKYTGVGPSALILRPKIHYPFGKPDKKGAMIIAPNHYSYFDPVSVQMPFPLRRINILATTNLFDTKIKNFFFTQMHCIVVDRENFSLSSFHEVVQRLEDGKLIVIFPEGKINKKEESGSLLSYKSGVVLMAHKAGAPILPMYLSKRNKFRDRQHIVVGKPINVNELLGKMPSMQGVTEITELLREKEIELREYLDSFLASKRKNSKARKDDKLNEREIQKIH